MAVEAARAGLVALAVMRLQSTLQAGAGMVLLAVPAVRVAMAVTLYWYPASG